jgi:hypothetical protein
MAKTKRSVNLNGQKMYFSYDKPFLLLGLYLLGSFSNLEQMHGQWERIVYISQTMWSILACVVSTHESTDLQ